MSKVLSKSADGKILYAVMEEVFMPGKGWRPNGIRYLHARDIGEARMYFNRASMGQARRIGERGMGIAPVVGFHVHDNHGEKLSA